jgi:hypothetical protein
VLFYLSLQLQFRIEVISYSMKSNNVKHNVQNDAMVQNLLRVMATAQATLLMPA